VIDALLSFLMLMACLGMALFTVIAFVALIIAILDGVLRGEKQ
jgi:hypothetical protein